MNNQETIAAFNKPHQTVVAINCINIGDDNDFSCFLANACYELWLAGKIEMAWKLYSTDPLMVDVPTMEFFLESMERSKKHKAESAEYFQRAEQFYTAD